MANSGADVLFSSHQNTASSYPAGVQPLEFSVDRQRRLSSYQAAGSPLDSYSLEEAIGVGSTGVVRLARHLETGELFACKAMYLEGGPAVFGPDGQRLPRVPRADVLREADALCGTHGPGLMRLREYYEHDGAVYLITDLLRGSDLLTELSKHGRFSEAQAQTVFRVLLQGTSRLNALGVVHRDLKLENVMLRAPGDLASACIVDFGLACRLEEGRPTACCGTPGFAAPEVFKHHIRGSRASSSFSGYGAEVDMWSLGAVLYQMLSGRRPFDAPTVPEVLAKVVSGNFTLRGPEWDDVSESAKHLVQQLLKPDVHARYTPYDAFAHPWISEALRHSSTSDHASSSSEDGHFSGQ